MLVLGLGLLVIMIMLVSYSHSVSQAIAARSAFLKALTAGAETAAARIDLTAAESSGSVTLAADAVQAAREVVMLNLPPNLRPMVQITGVTLNRRAVTVTGTLNMSIKTFFGDKPVLFSGSGSASVNHPD
ncbi:hypothetical protein Tfer_2775 [Thermincola ferriacetica]|uniref:Uncharacterized protein n=1 Tax=Thermincola ferriacetica TaxID=281456 RepID=A0A0L6VZC9_9FIRM|nr:hypothetical protein [Thermincola ferriacetica]KNZ68682.1 hypothetical protein Tfer_2775 [Thermincola ferriacetica]